MSRESISLIAVAGVMLLHMKKFWSTQRRSLKTVKGIALAALSSSVVLGIGAGSAVAAPSIPGLPAFNNLPGVSSISNLGGANLSPEVTNAVNGGSVALPAPLLSMIDDNFKQVKGAGQPAIDAARESLLKAVSALPLQDAQRAEAERIINQVFPGAPAPAPAPAPEAAPQQQARPANNPCPATARACIDLANQQTWLQENGQITWGPVPMASGAETPETETTKGFHNVIRKVKDDWSIPFDAPMAYSVYFTHDGQAFHEGSVHQRSHGCIHLNHDDAVHYFNTLQIGDGVYVW